MTSPPPLEMLRGVTRNLASAEHLESVLQSITDALVRHAGAAVARIALLLDDEQCPVCRDGIAAGRQERASLRGLHFLATSGVDDGFSSHRIPLESNIPAANVVRGGVPVHIADWRSDQTVNRHPAIAAAWERLGITALAGYPLDHHGEPLGFIGYISRRPIDPQEFALLGIFADQCALAIKSAQLYQEVERYKDRLQVENAYLQQELETERGFLGIVGESPALRAVLRKVQQVAAVETTVLLTGETGTGKELVARAIHAGSPRAERPLIKINCGAIPQGVVESELFGHERGAFTGALQRRIGRFELAHRGTLFMDEVGELPLDTQVKLLRVLQEGEFERVGSTELQTVDVRLVAATNRDLEREVADGRFRADLFYRLNVFPVRMPPLRERRSDIPLLVRHFLAHFQRKFARPLRGVTAETMTRLEAYDWPGNIRELQNVLERASVLSTSPVVEIAEPLGASDRPPENGAGPAPAGIVTLEEHERIQIRLALTATGGRVNGAGGAAALLAINPSTLRSRMQKLGISSRS